MELNEKIGKRDVGFCRVLRNVGVMPRGRIGLYEFWKSVGFDTVPRQQVRRRRSEWILHATDRGGGGCCTAFLQPRKRRITGRPTGLKVQSGRRVFFQNFLLLLQAGISRAAVF
ncbi:hypothetical protein Tc00.1047053511385.70 [Trypanosoma cruzi]|uniref:Uncharacterized protein n=1 Tax=Trypanosoma cruzi (strain CL Brener) TaxID=353153 RepID=Q4DKH0_TRYCC|nr:hypothetical protein Tc00.1047053511385.70 [Trypanosoma cruzi]EAN93021.1 hypothetical protein Tc00.1047053511385.70 [Trypanosoma cruzi]|eukprot:XP_814872.1 hypothetical protein [Trypanosoma cruzi strain CL Brener]